MVLAGSCSDGVNINAGVPQGSILEPLLFVIFNNDIVKDINSVTRLFVDDTCLYLIVDSPIQAASIVDQDFQRISA